MGREDFEGLIPPAMRVKRTRMQTEADQLDLEVFRLIGNLEAFGVIHRLNDVIDMSKTIGAQRWRVRQHMHKADREKTS